MYSADNPDDESFVGMQFDISSLLKREVCMELLEVLDEMDEIRRQACRHQHTRRDILSKILNAIQENEISQSVSVEMIEFWNKATMDPNQNPVDHSIRVMEAIVANKAGYSTRNEWTLQLKQNPCSKYALRLKESGWYW